jgi:hypothetical protein
MYEYEYAICNVFDADVFMRQCAALERHIPELAKIDFLIDVDGSQIQLYSLKGKKVSVFNTPDLGVEIRSQIDIDPYF